MTYTTRCVLYLLFTQGNRTATQVALHLWPNAEGWNRYSRSGTRGSRRGAGMWRAGGYLLGKLAKQGLVEREYGYFHKKRGGVRVFSKGYRLTGTGRLRLLDKVRWV